MSSLLSSSMASWAVSARWQRTSRGLVAFRRHHGGRVGGGSGVRHSQTTWLSTTTATRPKNRLLRTRPCRVGGLLTTTAVTAMMAANSGRNNKNGNSSSTLFSSSVINTTTNVTLCHEDYEGEKEAAVDHVAVTHEDEAAVANVQEEVVVVATAATMTTTDLNVKILPFDESVLTYDHYNGVTLHLGDYCKWIHKSRGNVKEERDVNQQFIADLDLALDVWRSQGRKGIWIHAPPESASLIPACVQAGFDFQQIKRGNTSFNSDDDYQNSHKKNTLILCQWLPDTPSKLPLGPTHQCGVGVIVLNPQDPSQMLVVQELSGPAAAAKLWKMPTGLLDPGEDIPNGAVRELLEETGLHATMQGIICFRQAHRPGGATSDLFFVCHMNLVLPNDDKNAQVVWTPQEDEIADIRWMSVQEFCDQERWKGSPLYTTLNECVLKLSQAAVAAGDATTMHALIDHQQLEVGLGRSFGGTNALFLPPNMTTAMTATATATTTSDAKL